MKKVDSTNGKVEFCFCVDVNEGYNRTTRSVYKNDAGEYFLIESEEYHIGSAYDYPDKLTPEQKEIFDSENPYWAKYFQKQGG
ncbi:MAG: hypothetical protein K5927_09985 [Lachnospiraceae bacterium]|nr:hypothetical protein [Lachnospiraceae bacterium]